MAFEFDLDRDDRELLTDFVRATMRFLKDATYRLTSLAPDASFLEGAQPRIARVMDSNEIGAFSGEVERAIETTSADQLIRAGLWGEALRAKLFVLGSWGAMLPGGGVLRRILDNLNALFGSLASVIPAAEPIKELKELIENAIKSFGD